MANRIIKLALWNTKTFTPITTHQELDSIMATLGFAPLAVTKKPCNVEDEGSGTLWREYSHSSFSSYKGSADPPRPKLPYPVMDGLHISTYQAFFDSVNFYLRFGHDLSDIFHIRGMRVNIHDKSGNWSLMEERDVSNGNLYAYREGLYDISAYNSWKAKKNEGSNCSNKHKGYNPNIFNRKSNILSGCKFVPMKDVVVQSLSNPKLRNYNKEEPYSTETD